MDLLKDITQGYIPKVLAPFTKSLTLLGVICVAVGVSWGFIDVWTGFRFEFLSNYAEIFIVILAIGVLLTWVGGFVWTRRFTRIRKFKIVGLIFSAGLLAMFVAPKNIHGPGVFLLFAAVCSWILCLILAISAVANRDVPIHKKVE